MKKQVSIIKIGIILWMMTALQLQANETVWLTDSVGAPKLSSIVTADDATDQVIIEGSGRAMRASDELSLVYQQAQVGNQITCNINSIEPKGTNPQAGMMWRSGLGETDPAYALVVYGGKLYLNKRVEAQGVLTKTVLKNVYGWGQLLRIAWLEQKLEFYISINQGQTWELLATEALSTNEGYWGVYASSGDNKVLGKSNIGQLQVDPVELSDAWTAINLQPGSDTAFGSSYYDMIEQSFQIQGSGSGFKSKSDQFHFVFMEVAQGADFELSARFAGFGETGTLGFGGIALRDDLSRGAVSASVGLRANGEMRWMRRVVGNGPMTNTLLAKKILAPRWFKLSKQGDLIQAYQSNDGENWVLSGSQNLTLNGNFYIGLAASSENALKTLPMSFDHVSVKVSNADLMEDADGDFLSDAWELEQFGTLAYGAIEDTDHDGFTNFQEFLLGTKANKADSDGDGILDSKDSTPTALVDNDSDGLPDAWELRHFGDLSQNASGDPDNDLVSNLTEFKQGRTPTKGALPDSNNLTKLVLF